MRSSFRSLSRNGPYSSRLTFLVTALILGFVIIIWITVRPAPASRELNRMRAELRARGEALSQKELVTPSPRWDLIQPFTNAANCLDKLYESPRLNLMSYTSNGVVLPSWRMEKPGWRDDPKGTHS